MWLLFLEGQLFESIICYPLPACDDPVGSHTGDAAKGVIVERSLSWQQEYGRRMSRYLEGIILD